VRVIVPQLTFLSIYINLLYELMKDEQNRWLSLVTAHTKQWLYKLEADTIKIRNSSIIDAICTYGIYDRYDYV
jgi:hypothetical protein